MEKITKYFKHDYENDTTIEYVNTGLYSMLNCSFTSEDPDYGTDTLHYTANPAVSIEQMAHEMCAELTAFLNMKESGRHEDISYEMSKTYGDYSNSTLYAIESALAIISKNYKAPKWFGHLEDVCREIARRIIKDGDKRFSICSSSQLDWNSITPDEYEKNAEGWYGIKCLGSIFDNEPNEYIVGVGYYGGGCFESAYVYDDGFFDEAVYNLGRAICNAVKKIHDEDVKEQSIVFAVKEKEEK